MNLDQRFSAPDFIFAEKVGEHALVYNDVELACARCCVDDTAFGAEYRLTIRKIRETKLWLGHSTLLG